VKVLCLTTRGLDKASTHYRFVQFLDFFREHGVQIEFIARDALNPTHIAALPRYDLLLNQRCLLPLRRARAVTRAARRSVLDFDDAIYTRSGRSRSWLTSLRVHARLRFLLQCSHLTTVANQHLAAYARRHAKHVEIVPMALDAIIWHPLEKTGETRPVRIGWSGSPANLGQIERLGSVLAPLFSHRHTLQLAILCGRRPTLPFDFDYQPFHPGTEPDFVRSLDIGLLPLVEDEFTRGKSPIKALQYMSCGVPVVGNVFGGAAEMLDETNSVSVTELTDWPTALAALADHPERRRQLGVAGLTRFRDRHELRLVGARWIALFRGELI
jgi:glycosyltransferase involved in cell wall biosynthesis